MIDDLEKNIEDKPPFLGSWNKIYALVLGELIVMVALFYLFTKAFS